MKEESPIVGEFLPTTYAREICYVKLMGAQSAPWKFYYDKVMGEFSPTMYTVKVLVCHG